MATGTVKKSTSEKGYGFIKPDDGTEDIFVHANNLEDVPGGMLEEGQKVSFDVATTPKGKQAMNVKLIR